MGKYLGRAVLAFMLLMVVLGFFLGPILDSPEGK